MHLLLVLGRFEKLFFTVVIDEVTLFDLSHRRAAATVGWGAHLVTCRSKVDQTEGHRAEVMKRGGSLSKSHGFFYYKVYVGRHVMN